MTIKELITTATNWTFARDAGDRISREVAAVRKEYIGKAAIETMPTGTKVKCVIAEIDWVSDYGMEGGWAVRVIYTSGYLKGEYSWTSDRVLEFGSK